MNSILKFLNILPVSHLRSLIIVFLLMLLAMLMETLSIGIIVPLISLFSNPDSINLSEYALGGFSFLSTLSETQLIAVCMLSLVSIFLIKSLYLSFFIWKQNAFSYSLLMKLTEELYLGYLSSPWLFHVQNNSAYLLRNINTEVSLAINNVLIPALKLISECLVVVGITGLLFYYEPAGSASVILFLVLTGLLIQKFTKKSLLRWGELRQKHEGLRILQIQQGLASVKEVKMLNRELQFVDNFRPHNLQSARAAQYRLFYQQIPRLFLEVIAVSGISILVITMILLGRDVSTFLPIVTLFAVAVFRLMPSVNRILEAMQNLHYGAPSLTVLDDQLQRIRKCHAPSNNPPMNFHKDIEFRDVGFAYPETGKLVVDNLSLKITKSSCIGLVGTSGSGKTTLVDMLLGLLPPAHGEILVDGQDIQQNLRGWHSCLGYVPQHISMIDDSLLKNIAFGLSDEDIDMKKVKEVASAAQPNELVSSLPEGLQTNIGEKGVKLSGGQRQRIGIARALYQNPDVLVLDEATSALDGETEKQVMDAIYNLDGDKTIIIIAHRLATVERCDTIYRMDKGKLFPESLEITQVGGEVTT
jgi:ABC-type multidrug transport system fused ATPase/permease subunit